MPMAVCSRLADYEALESKLELQGAVRLQALSPAQIEHYLTATDSQTVRLAIAQDHDLQELAQSPLMLSLMSVAYRDVSPQALPQLADSAARHRHLFDNYVQQMFTRRFSDISAATAQTLPYTPEQTRAWLSQLAQNMSHHAQSIFLLEQLQPSWLPTRGSYWLYLLATRLGGLWLIWLIPMLLVIMLGIMLFNQLPLLNGIVQNVLIPLGGLGMMGITVTIMDGLRQSYLARYSYLEAKVKSWWYTMLNILGIIVMVTLLVTGILALFYGLWACLGGLAACLSSIPVALFFGLRGQWQRFNFDIRLVEGLRWSWRGFGWPFFVSMLLAGVIKIMSGIPLQFLSFPLVMGLVFGFIFGWQGKIMVTKTRPNQGMWLSLKNGLFLGFVSGGIFMGGWNGVIVGNLLWSSEPGLNLLASSMSQQYSSYSSSQLIFLSLSSFLVVASPAVFWFGWLDVWQHYCLRVLLWRWGVAPLQYVEFLDFAAERILLRKVGGGYIFVHRLLLEYFAGLRDSEGTEARR